MHLRRRQREGIGGSRLRDAPEQPEAGRNDKGGEHEARRHKQNAVSSKDAGQSGLSFAVRD